MKPTRLLILFSLGILVMISVIGTGFFVIYEKTTEKQLMTYGQMTLDSGALYVDTIMKSTKDVMDSISLDSDVSKLINYEILSTNDLLTGLRRLGKYESSSYIIDSIYVFNRKNDAIYVSSPHMTEALYDTSSFPDHDASKYLVDYSGIVNLEPIFRTYSSVFPTVSEIPYISFLRYNMLEKENSSNVIMVNVRQDILSNLINEKHETDGGVLLLTDNSNKYRVISGGHKNLSYNLLDEVMSMVDSSKGNMSLRWNGRKYIVCYSDVLNGKAKLVLIADEREVASITKTKGYGNTIVFLGVLLGASLLLSIFIFKHIWRNIKEQQAEIARNEVEKKKLAETKRRNDILAFLHKEASADLINIAENERYFVVVSVIDNYKSEVLTKYEKKTDRIVLKNNICKTIETFLSEKKPAITTFDDDELCIAITPNPISTIELNSINEELLNRIGISVSFFLSNCCVMEKIPEEYGFLCESIPYKFLFGAGAIITVPMIEEHEMTQYSIPPELQTKMVDDILRLNIPEALLHLKEILDGVTCASFKSAQICIVNLSLFLDDAICRLQINNGIDKSVLAGALAYRFLNLDSLNDLYTLVESILYKTEKEITQSKNNRQSELVSDIIRITKEKCCNRNFSIDIVSEELGLSSAYLGKVFKRATGETFSRFVLNERMADACEKLANTDLPIDFIVSSVGFGDTPYFYKLFKQINGCTPTKYRATHRADDGSNSEF